MTPKVQTGALLLIFTIAVIAFRPEAEAGSFDAGRVTVIHDGLVTSYEDISGAVAAATPNSVLLVSPGIYHEHVVIDKPLKLEAAGEATITGEGLGTILTITNTTDVSVSGLRFVQSGTSYSTEDSGVKVVGARDVIISDNQLQDVFFGFLVRSSRDVTISNNTVVGLPQYTVTEREHAVYLWESYDVRVVGNKLSLVEDGTNLDHSYNTTIAGNSVSQARYGVHLMYSTDVAIEDNKFTNSISGVIPMFSQRVQIIRNTIVMNRAAGIGEGIVPLEDDDILIRNNTIAGNIIGLSLSRTPFTPNASAIVSNNMIAFNYIGIEIDTISHSLITTNNLIENVQDVSLVGDGNSSAVWSDASTNRGNFWSSRPAFGPVLIRDDLQQTLDSYKQLRVFTYSPAYLLLETASLTTPGGSAVRPLDQHPLDAPTMSLPWTVVPSLQGLAFPLTLTALAILLLWLIRSKRI